MTRLLSSLASPGLRRWPGSGALGLRAIGLCVFGLGVFGLGACGLGPMLPQCVLAQEAAWTVTRIDGTEVSGQLVAWSAEQMTLRADQQSVQLDASELLRVQGPDMTTGDQSQGLSESTEPTSGTTISPNEAAAWPGMQGQDGQSHYLELVDGTRLPYQAYEVEAGQATVSTPLAGQPLTISTEQIRFVQLTVGAAEQELRQQELAGDMLAIRKKNNNGFDLLTGILGDVSQEQVEFNWEGDVIPVKRSKVVALSYYHAHPPRNLDSVCWLALRGGGKLPITQIALANEMIEVRTIAGLELVFPVEAIEGADYSEGKLAYLSDLEPIVQQWTPRVDLPVSAELIRQHGLPRRDQSFSGSSLALFWPATKRGDGKRGDAKWGDGGRRDGRPGVGSPEAGKRSQANPGVTAAGFFGGELKNYRKGLALRSRTELRYRLPVGMQRFVAVAGIDPETASEGNVMLEIFAGRISVWRGEIDGGAAPAEINVLLGDARELRIIVDYGTNLDFGDRLHLAEARLSQ